MKLTRRNATRQALITGGGSVIQDEVFADGRETGLVVVTTIKKTDRTKTVMVKQSRGGIIRRVPEERSVWDISMEVFDRSGPVGVVTSDDIINYNSDCNKWIKARGLVS